MEKVIVEVRVGPRMYAEEIDLEDQREYYEELRTNGHNPRIERITFDHWVRPVTFDEKDIGQFNKDDADAHFIFGYWESLCQGDHAPRNLYEEDGETEHPTIITVRWE